MHIPPPRKTKFRGHQASASEPPVSRPHRVLSCQNGRAKRDSPFVLCQPLGLAVTLVRRPALLQTEEQAPGGGDGGRIRQRLALEQPRRRSGDGRGFGPGDPLRASRHSRPDRSGRVLRPLWISHHLTVAQRTRLHEQCVINELLETACPPSPSGPWVCRCSRIGGIARYHARPATLDPRRSSLCAGIRRELGDAVRTAQREDSSRKRGPWRSRSSFTSSGHWWVSPGCAGPRIDAAPLRSSAHSPSLTLCISGSFLSAGGRHATSSARTPTRLASWPGPPLRSGYVAAAESQHVGVCRSDRCRLRGSAQRCSSCTSHFLDGLI